MQRHLLKAFLFVVFVVTPAVAVYAATIEHPTRPPSGGGADTKLSNVSGTTVGASLVPGTDDTINLGSLSKRFHDAFIADGLSIGTVAAGSNTPLLVAQTAANPVFMRAKNLSTSSQASMQLQVYANDQVGEIDAYGSTYSLDPSLTSTVVIKSTLGRVFIHGSGSGGTLDLLSGGTDGDTPDLRVQADHSIIILKQFTSLPACTAAGDVGKLVMYSKSAGATISQCLCKRTSSTYAWAGTHSGADCT